MLYVYCTYATVPPLSNVFCVHTDSDQNGLGLFNFIDPSAMMMDLYDLEYWPWAPLFTRSNFSNKDLTAFKQKLNNLSNIAGTLIK